MAVDVLEGGARMQDDGLDAVPVDPFRERFALLSERDGLTLNELAHRLGFTRKRGTEGDTARVGRMLGLTPDQGRLREHVTHDNAVKLCDALHIDYFEVGL
jgi:hypothetical protein